MFAQYIMITTQLIYLKRLHRICMGQFFTDDIDALLRSGHGDATRLAKIKTDFLSTKLVTIEDRKYVDGLVSRYLQPVQKQTSEKTIKTENRIVPPPPVPREPPNLYEVKQQKPKEEKVPRKEGKAKIRNVVITACAAVFVILVISALVMNQGAIRDITPNIADKSLEIDATSYTKADIIAVAGKVKDLSQTVKITITNPVGQEIWDETVNVKQNREFSTLILAGGEKWDTSGTYTLSVIYSENKESTTFEFNPDISS